MLLDLEEISQSGWPGYLVLLGEVTYQISEFNYSNTKNHVSTLVIKRSILYKFGQANLVYLLACFLSRYTYHPFCAYIILA